MTNGEKLKEIFPYLESDDTDLVKVLNIDNLKSWWNAEYKEPTTKNDLGVDAILRADARSLICEIDIKHHTFGISRKAFKDLYNGIDELPPVTPIRPKGHWIVQPSNKEQGERNFIWWKCSECGQVIFSETEHDRLEFHSFCGKCGADMREAKE